MDNQERVKILDRAFSIMEEIIKNFYIDDEELFRERVKNAIQNAILENDDQFEYKALLDAQARFDDLSFAEITEMYELLADDDDWDEEEDLDEDEDDVSLYDDDDWAWDDNEHNEPIEFNMRPELPKVFVRDKTMRKDILNTKLGDAVGLYDKEHRLLIFKLVMRLAFLDKYYCYMIRYDDLDDKEEGVFYEYVIGKHATEDKMVLVEDKDLIQKLGTLL